MRALLVVGLAGLLVYVAWAWSWRQLYPLHYGPAISRHAEAHRLDPHLVAAIIRTESRFNPRATSPRDARGLMQLMPDTATWVASRAGIEAFDADMLYDPEVNIALGTWYLADLRRQFGGDLLLVLAAYNGGRRNVERWVEEGRLAPGAPLGDLLAPGPTGRVTPAVEARLAAIPFRETRDFVRRVLVDYARYRWIYGPRLGWPQATGTGNPSPSFATCGSGRPLPTPWNPRWACRGAAKFLARLAPPWDPSAGTGTFTCGPGPPGRRRGRRPP